MTLVLLVRHAVTDVTGKRLYGRSPGISLSEAGRAQADRLAERLSSVRLAAVYSSPIERCLETAAPVASTHRLRVQRIEDLLEIDYGRWTGRAFGSLARTRLWRRVHGGNPSAARFPGGETLAEAQRRGVAAMERIAEWHPRAAVAVVTHGDMVALLLAYFGGIHVDLFQRIEVAPASVSAMSIGEGVPRIRRINDTGTLEDLITRRVRG